MNASPKPDLINTLICYKWSLPNVAFQPKIMDSIIVAIGSKK